MNQRFGLSICREQGFYSRNLLLEINLTTEPTENSSRYDYLILMGVDHLRNF